MIRSFLFFFLILTTATAQTAVPWGYEAVAKEFEIPGEILYSVALQESEGPGIGRPWPWTANVKGRGYYFESREDLYRFLGSLLARGCKHFDIGLGQVNWHWNGQRFRSLWEATDPYVNLRVAASILRERYFETRSWAWAVGRYHAPNNDVRASSYIAGVGRKLARVLGE